MTYKEQYKSSRKSMIYFLFAAIGNAVCLCSIEYSWKWVVYPVVFVISLGQSIKDFLDMIRAKRYIIFDNFLEEVQESEYVSAPEGFMSKEDVETKAIANWWKVNEKEHQN